MKRSFFRHSKELLFLIVLTALLVGCGGTDNRSQGKEGETGTLSGSGK